MKSKRDIEKLFRDNEHKLHERPSNRAWDRLERKLDGHASTSTPQLGRQRPIYRIMGMAATLLFLVAMVALMTTLFRNQESALTASAETMTPPLMEELKHYDDQKGVYTIAVSYQRYLNQKPNVFAEGPTNKKLIPPVNLKRNANSSERLLAAAKTKKKESEQQALTKVQKIEQGTNSAPQITAAPTPSAGKAPAKTMETPPAMASTPANSQEAVTIEAVPEEYYATDAYTTTEAGHTRSSHAKVQTPPASSEDAKFQNLDMATNAISYSTDLENAGVDHFQWLIGQWQAPLSNNRQTIEKWQQEDEFTISGSGQLIVNGDTTFTEEMKIQKIGEHLYYLLALDKNNRTVKFKLRSLAPSTAIFETAEKGVPNQLILKQLDPNTFSTTLQNASPSRIEQSQLQYLQQRNTIELNQRTVRKLSRASK